KQGTHQPGVGSRNNVRAARCAPATSTGTGVGLEAPDVAVAAPHPTTATTAPTDNRERINFIVGSILITLSLAVGREPLVSMRVEHRKYELVTKFLAAGSARLGQSAPNPSPASARLAQNRRIGGAPAGAKRIGRAGEIRTRGLPVPNQTRGPTKLDPNSSRKRVSSASPLTP